MPELQTNGHNGHAHARRLPISLGDKPKKDHEHFDETETRIAVKLAEALMPGGTKFLPRADERTVRRLEEILAEFGSQSVRHYGGMLRTFEHAVRPFTRNRAFSDLHEYERTRLLGEWSEHTDLARRTLLLGLTTPLKVAYFDDEMIYRALGAPHRYASQPEKPRHMER